MNKISRNFSDLNMAHQLPAQAGRGRNKVSESPRPASRTRLGASHPVTLMSPDKATGKWFVIPLYQRAPG